MDYMKETSKEHVQGSSNHEHSNTVGERDKEDDTVRDGKRLK